MPPIDALPIEEAVPAREAEARTEVAIIYGDKVVAVVPAGEGAPVIARVAPGSVVVGEDWTQTKLDALKADLAGQAAAALEAAHARVVAAIEGATDQGEAETVFRRLSRALTGIY